MGSAPLIWSGGRIIPSAALSVGVTDRTFEHGLGLFETLRTWNGRAVLLDRHLERMIQSARVLGLPLDTAALPDAAAVSALRQANSVSGDVRLRITVSGGVTEFDGSVVWMTCGDLPEPAPVHGVKLLTGPLIEHGTWLIDFDDPLARHKTLNYWLKRLALQQAQRFGSDESLSRTADGAVWEGTRTNLFAIVDQTLITPSGEGPILRGIMRERILELASSVGLKIEQVQLSPRDLIKSEEIFLTNSVRGIVPVGQIGQRQREAPGRWTQALQQELLTLVSR